MIFRKPKTKGFEVTLANADWRGLYLTAGSVGCDIDCKPVLDNQTQEIVRHEVTIYPADAAWRFMAKLKRYYPRVEVLSDNNPLVAKLEVA